MRLHLVMDDDLVRRIDHVAGPRGRTGWIVKVVTEKLDDEERWELILGAAGSISDTGHEWDEDPAAWVRAQRRADPRRVG